MINQVKAVWPWFGNVVEAVYTVAHGMWDHVANLVQDVSAGAEGVHRAL